VGKVPNAHNKGKSKGKGIPLQALRVAGGLDSQRL